MQWPNTQAKFAAALLDPDLPAPEIHAPSKNTPSTKRFNVYRNNVTVSLREALEQTFPVVRQLVGDEFFAAMARIYIAQSLPKTPVLIDYGSDFPTFLASFEPVSELSYLPDLAQLEYARTTAYHAPDAFCATINDLAAVPEDQIDDVRSVLHPSLVMLASDWPIFSIWAAHQRDDPETSLARLHFENEFGLVIRPKLDVHVLRVNQPTYRFLTSLSEGLSLGKATEALSDLDQNSLSEIISGLFEAGLVVEVVI